MLMLNIDYVTPLQLVIYYIGVKANHKIGLFQNSSPRCYGQRELGCLNEDLYA
jgi:hypothetical protein